jgi:Uma2 family endonuclease
MSTRTQLMTAEELLRMPEDGFRYELVHGELRKIPPAGHIHGRLAATLTASLGRHVATNQLGAVYAAETGFILRRNPDTVRAPDVAFIRQERFGK